LQYIIIQFNKKKIMVTQNNVSQLVTQEWLPFSVTIPSADVLTLNTTPVVLIPAQGAGVGILVSEVSFSITYGTVAYATNGVLNVGCDTATIAQFSSTAAAFLFATVSRTVRAGGVLTTAAGNTQIIANKAITASVATGNPTAGDSVITIQGVYKQIAA
jgi:hypothetical protein